MSKGSGRRPQQVSEDEATANWARIFGKAEKAPEPEPDLLGNYIRDNLRLAARIARSRAHYRVTDYQQGQGESQPEG